MTHRLALWIGLVLVIAAAPASAQIPALGLPDPATGETYHIEFGAGLWSPSADLVIASESLGIAGTDIDLVNDLGLISRRFGHLRLVLRPSTKHKFRFSYTPMRYQSEAVLTRPIVFNGIRFNAGVPVQSTLLWKAYRLGYEYDFLYRDRWFVGFVLDVKYSDVEATLDSLIASEFARARGPVPAVGGIGRFYVVPNISITFEMTGFKLPETLDEQYRGSYVEIDTYGSINFTDHFGAQVGFRSLDVNYTVEGDRGDLRLGGLYFGGVLRY
jgi:hypothetical protein